MKKRTLNKKLRLRKDTVRSLDQNAMSQAQGGYTEAGTVCDQLTLSPHCAHSCDTCGCGPVPSSGCSFACTVGC